MWWGRVLDTKSTPGAKNDICRKNLPVSFDYVIIKRPTKALLDVSSRPKFEKLLFEILLSIMDDNLKSEHETGEIDEVGDKKTVESSA